MSFIVTNTNDSGAGSLRQAIIDANASGSAATITFNISGSGPHTITPTSALPDITNTVTINGYSQSGASENTLTTGSDAVLKIVINGSSAGADVNGLTLASGSDGSTIQGLVIQGFDKRGIVVNGDNSTIRGNYLGTDATGTTAVGNGSGMWLGSANNVTVGGSDAGSRNVISGNATGLYLAGSSNNTVIGNFIGTNASGIAAVANTSMGIGMGNSADNLIGGSTVGDRNLISGNQYGIYLFENNNGTQISGNYVGTDVTGTSAIGNAITGIQGRSYDVTIGGSNAGEGNLISGNSSHGIYLESLSDGDIIQGNYIGTNAAGTSAIANGGRGIRIKSANVTVGGSAAGAGNLISGNNNDGILLSSDSDGTVIQGNRIGTTADGTGTIQNNGDGIQVQANGITIGGSNAGEGNLIAGNRDNGILVSSNGGELQILGNSIVDNGDIGIDLGNNGVTANDTNDSDTGSNTLQNFPVFDFAERVSGDLIVKGSLNSIASTTFRIEFFLNDSLDATGYGEGDTYLGSQNITTNASNTAEFTVNLGDVASLGQFVTATVTNLTTNETSEFSLGAEVLAPTVSISPTTLSQTEETQTDYTFTVSLSQASSEAITVNYQTNDGTASVGADYTDNDGTLTFAAGEVSKTITVSSLGDTLDEADETFTVQLTSTTASGGLAANSTATATIVDNDAAPNASIGNVTVDEATGTATFNVTLDVASGRTISIDYATADGSAVAPSDYTPVTNTLTFAPGDLSKTITVPIIDDALDEANETFSVTLSNATNVSLTNTQGTATITDNDTSPTVASIVRSDANPTNASTVDFTVTFDRTVTGVDATDFSLTTAGLTSPSITSVTGTGTTRTVTVNTGTGDGTLRLDLIDDDTIIDAVTNPLSGSGINGDFTMGESYIIDKMAPSITSVTPNLTFITDSNVGTDAFTLTVIFDEDMNTAINPTISFPTSGEDASTTLTNVSGNWTNATTYVATYDIADANEEIADVDIQISDAQDEVGNI